MLKIILRSLALHSNQMKLVEFTRSSCRYCYEGELVLEFEDVSSLQFLFMHMSLRHKQIANSLLI